MIYTFPEVKFVEANTLEEQFSHIKSEYMEVIKADGLGERDNELCDLWHSIESYLRMRQAQGIDISLTINQTVDKNRQRNYYTDKACKQWLIIKTVIKKILSV